MATDDLAAQGARASAAMLLTYFAWIIWGPSLLWLIVYAVELLSCTIQS